MFEVGSNLLNTGTPDKGAQAGKKATSFIQGASLPKEVDLMTNKYQLLYYLKKQKADKAKGITPIYLRISCGKRTEISLNKWVNPEKWNPAKQCLVGNSPEAKAINAFLKTVEVKFHEIHRNLLDKGELITSDTLKAHFLGKSEQQRTVLQAFDYYLTQIKTKIGRGYSTSTLRKYEYLKNHFTAFVQKTSACDDLLLSRIDLFFIKEFQTYLMTDRQAKNKAGEIVSHKGCDFNAALKYVKMLRTIVNVAVSFRWIDHNPFTGFKEKFQEVDQEFLNEVELRLIMNKSIAIERLAMVRDIFVFCCFTGLAYVDVAKLSKEHIVLGMDARKMIDIGRTKTNTDCTIPLVPVAEAILSKYTEHPGCLHTGRLLPVISNQKYNAYLKEIADISGIVKNLTTHVARRTFATVASDLGVPAETIIKVIGHKGFNHLHLYNKSGQAKISKDMDVFRNKDWGPAYEVTPRAAINEVV
jgi:site-specific recombinase XerD